MTPRITPERATELQALADAATEGPWRTWTNDPSRRGAAVETSWSHDPDGADTELITDWCSPADAEFIAAARQAVPDLLADRTDARAEIERLHTWDGLMSLLDERWPEDIWPATPDRDDRDPGARLLAALRREARTATQRDAAVAKVERVEALVNSAPSVPIHAGGGNLVSSERMIRADDLRAALAGES